MHRHPHTVYTGGCFIDSWSAWLQNLWSQDPVRFKFKGSTFLLFLILFFSGVPAATYSRSRTSAHDDLLSSELAHSGEEDDLHAESDSAVWDDFRELWEDTERAPLFLSRAGSSVEQMSKYSSWAWNTRATFQAKKSRVLVPTLYGMRGYWQFTFTEDGAISGGESSSRPNALLLSARTSA